MTRYFVKNIETGESIEVLPHTAGEGTFSFAPASLAGGDGYEFANSKELYTFDNADASGEFVNNDVVQLDITGKWDISKTAEDFTPEVVEEVAPESPIE
jgi:hypothetical protein